MKYNWLKIVKTLPLLAAVAAPTVSANVIITEYIEGGGNNKAIEISNFGNTEVNLSGYQLIKFSNGTDSQAIYDYSGDLAAGASLVIYNSSALAEFKTAAGAISESSIVQHNGNDQFTLNKDGAVIDSIGQYLNTANFAKDVTLRRNAGITIGDIDFTDSWTNGDWFSAGKDVADGLGCSGITACGVAPEDPADPDPENPGTPAGSVVVITEIVNGTDANKVIEISNIGDTDIDLADNKYKLWLYADGSEFPTEQVFLQGNLVAGSSLVVYNANAGVNFQKAAPLGLEAADVATFTGNDVIVLLSGSGEAVVDSFGQIGSSSVWISATDTLRRKDTVVAGNTDANDDFSSQVGEWASELQDTFDGLGCKGEAACVGTEAAPTAGTTLVVTPCFNCSDLNTVFDINTYNHDVYYATTLAADSSDKTAFRAGLTQDISANYTQLSYGDVWTALTYTDEDPSDSDNVLLLYTGRSMFKNQNASGDQANNQDYWNREHVWAKSHGFPSSSQKGYTDIHHLRPADVSLNSARGNLDFANGGDQVETSDNKRVANTSWEPRDEVKGDVARMTLYMDVRYENNEAAMPDLVLIDSVGVDAYENTGDPVANLGKLCDLITWHAADPVDAFELSRNNKIHEYQGNRNPFIDHPEWVAIAFKDVCVTEVDSIGFAVQNDVALSTVLTSEVQTLTGIDSPLAVSVANGEYSIGCNDTFTNTAGTVNSGDTICLRHTSSGSYSTQQVTLLTAGDSIFSFTSVTMVDPTPMVEEPLDETPVNVPPVEGDAEVEVPLNEHPSNETPGQFSIAPIHNAALSSVMTSDIIVVTGIQVTVPISVNGGGEYSKSCNGSFTSEAGTVSNGDFVCVRHTSSSDPETQTRTTLNINGVEANFVSTTKSKSYEAPEIQNENNNADELSGLGSLGGWLFILPCLLIFRSRKRSQYLRGYLVD